MTFTQMALQSLPRFDIFATTPHWPLHCFHNLFMALHSVAILVSEILDLVSPKDFGMT